MSLFGSLLGTKKPPESIDTPLALVTFAASLVSNQEAIGHLLDTVRSITARLQPGQPPSAGDDSQLLDVYLGLELYLTTKEPLRSFTADTLRRRLSEQLLTTLQAHQKDNRNLNPGKDMVH